MGGGYDVAGYRVEKKLNPYLPQNESNRHYLILKKNQERNISILFRKMKHQKYLKWKSLGHLQVFATPLNSPGQNTGVAFPFSRGSSQPRDWTQVSHIADGFFANWATREAQEYGVGSLSLLQQIFPTQESNQGLLLCKEILLPTELWWKCLPLESRNQEYNGKRDNCFLLTSCSVVWFLKLCTCVSLIF